MCLRSRSGRCTNAGPRPSWEKIDEKPMTTRAALTTPKSEGVSRRASTASTTICRVARPARPKPTQNMPVTVSRVSDDFAFFTHRSAAMGRGRRQSVFCLGVLVRVVVVFGLLQHTLRVVEDGADHLRPDLNQLLIRVVDGSTAGSPGAHHEQDAVGAGCENRRLGRREHRRGVDDYDIKTVGQLAQQPPKLCFLERVR